jgi:predicted DNA binding protein
MLKDVRLIKIEDSHALIKTTWIKEDSSYRLVFEQNCLYTSPVKQRDGYEVYTVITERPDELERLLGKLKEIGSVKVFNVGDVKETANKYALTTKQMEALTLALSNDYYTWPRKVNLDELSKKTGINRRTLQENLRRAEKKVFSSLKKEILLQEETDPQSLGDL